MSYCIDDPSRTSRTGNQEVTDLSRLLESLVELKLKYDARIEGDQIIVELNVDKMLSKGYYNIKTIYIFNLDESLK